MLLKLLILLLLLLLLPIGAERMRETLVSLQFLKFRQSVEIHGRGISLSQGRNLTQRENKRKQISMHRVGLEPTSPVFKQAKPFYASDRATTVIGFEAYRKPKLIFRIVNDSGNLRRFMASNETCRWL
jgi:hypothetical protein